MKSLAILFVLLTSTFISAHAAATEVSFINTGKAAYEVDEIPIVSAMFGDQWKLGYLCQHIGVLGADIATWDCEMAVVNIDENNHMELPEFVIEQIDDKYSMRDAKRSFWNRYGFWSIIGVLLLWGIMSRFNHKGRAKK